MGSRACVLEGKRARREGDLSILQYRAIPSNNGGACPPWIQAVTFLGIIFASCSLPGLVSSGGVHLNARIASLLPGEWGTTFPGAFSSKIHLKLRSN